MVTHTFSVSTTARLIWAIATEPQGVQSVLSQNKEFALTCVYFFKTLVVKCCTEIAEILKMLYQYNILEKKPVQHLSNDVQNVQYKATTLSYR